MFRNFALFGTLGYIGLKMANLVPYSWWWVLAPSIIALLVWCLLVVAGLAVLRSQNKQLWNALRSDQINLQERLRNLHEQNKRR